MLAILEARAFLSLADLGIWGQRRLSAFTAWCIRRAAVRLGPSPFGAHH